MSEMVASGAITETTTGNDINCRVSQFVVDAVAANSFVRATAIDAGPADNVIEQPLFREIAIQAPLLIECLASLKKEDGPAFIGSIVLPTYCQFLILLIAGHIRPAFRAPVSALLSRTHALATFVGKPQRAAEVAHKYLWCGRKLMVAPIANSQTGR